VQGKNDFFGSDTIMSGGFGIVMLPVPADLNQKKPIISRENAQGAAKSSKREIKININPWGTKEQAQLFQ
jgi:hypothetical protein